MTIAPQQKQWTDEEFMALPEDGRYELVNGELVNMGNSGMEHGYIASNLIILFGRMGEIAEIGRHLRLQYRLFHEDRQQAIARCLFCCQRATSRHEAITQRIFSGIARSGRGNSVPYEYGRRDSRQDCGVFRERNAPGLGDSSR